MPTSHGRVRQHVPRDTMKPRKMILEADTILHSQGHVISLPIVGSLSLCDCAEHRSFPNLTDIDDLPEAMLL
jgi:hypothetical protein